MRTKDGILSDLYSSCCHAHVWIETKLSQLRIAGRGAQHAEHAEVIGGPCSVAIVAHDLAALHMSCAVRRHSTHQDEVDAARVAEFDKVLSSPR